MYMDTHVYIQRDSYMYTGYVHIHKICMYADTFTYTYIIIHIRIYICICILCAYKYTYLHIHIYPRQSELPQSAGCDVNC